MAKAKPRPRAAKTKRVLDSYTIKGFSKPIKPGDCVLMRAPNPSKPPYVARVEAIEAGVRGVRVRVRWYYRPEESVGGRRRFHGAKEVFLSDHYDVQSAESIEGTCTVHSFRAYTALPAVAVDDFFCRFEYRSATGAFVPDRIAVRYQAHGFIRNLQPDAFCKCEMPYNPDDLMIQCEGCSDWYHPPCINMTVAEAKKTEHFFCQSCSPQNEKKTQNAQRSSKQSEVKVGSKRRRR